MRFQILAIFLLPLISALPLPDNATSDAANVLANGIQANIDHGQQEIQSVQTLQSLESNGAAPAAITTGIANAKAALNLAIADRTSNQALAVDLQRFKLRRRKLRLPWQH
jgi:hypothetical protein